MPDTYSMNRTLILGLGHVGGAVVGAVRDRLASRYRQGLPVAFLVLAPPEAPASSVPAIALDTGLEAGIEALMAGIIQALREISRIGGGHNDRRPPTTDRRDGRAMSAGQPSSAPSAVGDLRPSSVAAQRPRSNQVEIYLVAGLDDPLAEAVVDVAYLARQVIRLRLNAPGRVSGFLLVPDPLAADDPTPALERAQEALQQIEAFMGPHDGYRRSFGEDLTVEGWGPVFNGPCYLIDALNRDGLALASSEARCQLVAEAMVQLAAAPLGRAVESLAPATWDPQGRPGYAGLGISALVYPAQAVHERLARRLARDVLAAWLAGGADGEPGSAGEGASPAELQARAFLAANELTPQAVGQRLLPGELLAQVGFDRPLPIYPAWGELPRLREWVDDAAGQRAEQLNSRRPGLEEQAGRLGADLIHRLGDEVCRRLEAAPPAGLRKTLEFVVALKTSLSTQAETEEETAERLWQALQELDPEGEALAARLARQGGALPVTWRGLARALLRPHGWPAFWHTWQALQHTRMAYAVHMERQLRLAAEILRCDLVVGYLAAAIQAIEGWEARLAALSGAVEAALESLDERPGTGGGEAEGTGDRDARGQEWRGAEGWFDLEWSVVTSEILEALWAEHGTEPLQELAGLAAEAGPLSRWATETPDGRTIGDAALEYARRRLAWVTDVGVTELLARRCPQPDEQQAVVGALMDAAVPFITWDETALSTRDGEAIPQATLLGVPAAEAPAFEVLVEETYCPVRVVPTQDRHRITALRVVWGLGQEGLLSAADNR